MSDAPRRRVSGWKVAGVIAGLLLLIGIATGLWMKSVADRRWKAMEKKVRELTIEVRAREPVRPVLRGEARAGSAWDDYSLAIAEAAKFKASGPALGDFLSRSPKADRSKVESLLATHGAALDHLRAGARRASGVRPRAWEEGTHAPVPPVLSYHALVALAASQARFHAEAGRAGDAAELLLDAAQFARDIGSNSVMVEELIAVGLLGMVFEELRSLILTGKLPPERLLEIERELGILDGSYLRHGEILVNEALSIGCGMIRDQPGNFLGRLMIAGAFDTLFAAMERAAASEQKPWAEAQRELAEISGGLDKSKNPIVSIAGPALFQNSRILRGQRAQLRLLRAAAAHRAGGPIPGLEDPFGGRLRSTPAGAKLKVWSVGEDGVDDGGAGEWNPWKGKDIVLEVDR